jgi:hypothetical protein
MTSAITGRVKPRIEIAPGGSPAGDPSAYLWADAGKRRAKTDIVITAGRDDEASEVEAGSLSTTMDNRDGRLSPRNILGPWYGQIGRGTPVRVVLDRVSDPFTRTVSGSWGSTPEGFAWVHSNITTSVNGSQGVWSGSATNQATIATITGVGSADAEIYWSASVPVLPAGANFVSAAVLRYTNSSNYLRLHTELTPAGTVAVKIDRIYQGSSTTLFSTTVTSVTYSANQRVRAHARADGPYVMVKVWTGNASDEPSTWQAVATDETLEGVDVGLFFWRLNSNAGAFAVNVDDVSVTNIVWSGNVPEWAPKWPEKSGTDSTIPLAGACILRRLSQGASPVNSPLRNQLGGLAGQGITTFNYYPLEEANGAQQAGEANGGTPALVRGVTFGNDDTLPGSAPTAVLDTQLGSIIQFKINSRNTPNGWSALWFFKMSALPSITTEMVSMNCSGTMRRWSLTVDNLNIQWKAYDYAGTQIATASSGWAVDPRQWVAMQLETNVSGGNTEVDLLWHQVGEEDFFAATDTYTGSSTKPDYFSIIGGSDNMSVAHLWFGDNDLPFVDSTFALVSDGFRGEEASARIERLCAENGVPAYVLTGESEPMGRQRTLKLVDLLRECEAADQGTLCERGNALMYIPRVRRYNMPVSLALDWSLGHLDEAPEPVDDDQRLRNKWTVSRVDGGSVTLADDASISAAGTYDDSADLNIAYDFRLPDFAAWFLNRDTADYLRWPRIKINLLAHPELIRSWLGCRIGSRITIANPPSAQLAGEVIDLIIEGYTQTINNYAWTVELSCSPAKPWIIGAYDDTTYRYDAVATVNHDFLATDDTVDIVCADRLGFYSSTSVPYVVSIAGQLNRVLGCSLPDSVGYTDGTFEKGVGSGWYAGGGTLADSTAQAHTGTHSALLTTTGSPTRTYLRNSAVSSAAPGQQHTVTAWVRCSVARNVIVCLDWYNGATFIDRAINQVAVAANTWTQISVSGTAPAGTTRIEYGPEMKDSPANGTLLYADDIDAVRTDVQNSRQLVVLDRAIDGFSKALPAGSSFRIATPARYGL